MKLNCVQLTGKAQPHEADVVPGVSSKGHPLDETNVNGHVFREGLYEERRVGFNFQAKLRGVGEANGSRRRLHRKADWGRRQKRALIWRPGLSQTNGKRQGKLGKDEKCSGGGGGGGGRF